MRIVLDTNVIIAGLYSKRGASFKILAAAMTKQLDYAVSPLIALEYIGKIEDKVQEGLLTLPLEYYLKIIKVFIQNGYQVLQPILNRPMLPDNSDDKILECAIAAHCQAILTFNRKDFPEGILRRYALRAITPGEFLQMGGLNT